MLAVVYNINLAKSMKALCIAYWFTLKVNIEQGRIISAVCRDYRKLYILRLEKSINTADTHIRRMYVVGRVENKAVAILHEASRVQPKRVGI